MQLNRFDQLVRAAIPLHDRRTSLMALGAAALGASLLNPAATEARNGGKRNKRKKRCRKEQKQCRRAVNNLCEEEEPDENEEACRDLLLPCCRSCKTKSTLVCVVRAFQSLFDS